MKTFFLAPVLLLLACSSKPQAQHSTHNERPPNVIIIFTDDQGYQDLSCYGSQTIATPNIDQLAQEGIRFTDFYVSASVCSPSRASLLTGRYPDRNGVGGVLLPGAKGLDSAEVTIAELLRPLGYRTACIGKWHLGDHAQSLPNNQGFDVFFGLPYSNDMHLGDAQPFAENATFLDGYTLEKAKADQAFNRSHTRQEINESGRQNLVPLMEGQAITEYPADQATLTRRYFERAISFIDPDREEPFFIYLAPTMPHVPLFASEAFAGSSNGGLYGDVIEEIDHYTGQLLAHLKELGLEENTIVIFTSDNGPWLAYKELAGSANPLRGGKFSNFEGGVRVPCIMRWKNKFDGGRTSTKIASTLDLLPTIAHYANAPVDPQMLDGQNLSAHLERVSESTQPETMLYTKNEKFYGIRQGEWKYLPYGGARREEDNQGPELYNLREDIAESNNVHDAYPEVVARLQQALAERKASTLH
ncbi:sulfatase [Neolewinella lacunae]|uniref:Sulfatase n=1 Tax=Neolewinella lacunae TaxID=1517758 RepID=A0A923PLT5_9BACT|nr:sulfatase [Neolewinella lacunae]MBC6995076.1 sulfatase [Neolewinella lacunae]MDN3635375.1 sulfatase [Neolewinella lacunae]